MAHVTADRVRDTSTSTGTGNFVVSGTAPSGFRTLSAVLSTNDTFYYVIQHQSLSEWEVGTGTYSSANTFARTTVLSSSNANSAVNFSAGTKDVFLTLAATKTVQITPSGIVELPASSTIGGEPIPISSTFTSETFTASAGQTTFTISGGYTVGQISVFRNGAKLVVPTDVTASNGTTIVLVNAASLNDTIEIQKFTSIGLANAVLKTGDTMSGTLSAPNINLSTASGALSFTSTGQRITGDMSNATIASRLAIQDSTTNGNTGGVVIPNGSGTASSWSVYNNSNPNNAGFGGLRIDATEFWVRAGITGSGSYVPMIFQTGGSERFRIGTSGQLGIGGANYGTSGQVLTSQGSGAAPVWSTPSSGGVTSLSAGNGITVSASTGAVTVSQDIYTGSAANNTTYPIGTCILLGSSNGGFVAASSQTVRIVDNNANNAGFFIGTGSQPALTGTWRIRGQSGDFGTGSGAYVLQRTA